MLLIKDCCQGLLQIAKMQWLAQQLMWSRSNFVSTSFLRCLEAPSTIAASESLQAVDLPGSGGGSSGG